MRPIDADRLKDVIRGIQRAKQLDRDAALALVLSCVDDMIPVSHADIVPIGTWELRGGKLYCTNCGKRACVTRDREDFWYTAGTKYCPSCGAFVGGGARFETD